MNDVIYLLHQMFPNAHCELNYETPYQLMVAVMLSAQTTDRMVNEVTKVFFKEYPTAESQMNLSLDTVEQHLEHLGLYHNKSKNLIAMAKMVHNDFHDRIPNNMDMLLAVPGIGRKSANVILSEIFKVPRIPVDTHVFRVSKRLGFADEKDDVLAVEKKLMAMFPKETWISLHHYLIFLGRYMCFSQRPLCGKCLLNRICKFKHKME